MKISSTIIAIVISATTLACSNNTKNRQCILLDDAEKQLAMPIQLWMRTEISPRGDMVSMSISAVDAKGKILDSEDAIIKINSKTPYKINRNHTDSSTDQAPDSKGLFANIALYEDSRGQLQMKGHIGYTYIIHNGTTQIIRTTKTQSDTKSSHLDDWLQKEKSTIISENCNPDIIANYGQQFDIGDAAITMIPNRTHIGTIK